MPKGTETVVAVVARLADGRRVFGVLVVLDAPAPIDASARPSRRTLRGERVIEAELLERSAA